jgi:putative hydrolase of the HAD superfamily
LSAGKPSIKAVTFDLWETLLFEKNGWNLRRTNARCESVAQTLSKFGVKISVERLALAFKKMASWLESVWRMNNEVTHLDQIRFIIRTASEGSITIKEEWIDDLSSAYVSPFFKVTPYLNPDASKVLQWLEDRNKLIGLMCNTGLTPGFGLRRFLAREDLAEYFDLMLFSDEVGIRKPNPKMFQIATQRLKVKPYEIVHIGDNLKSDVWGAKNAGFKAIYLSTEVGRDRIAESDPTSLVSISRKINNLSKDQIVPDKTIRSLAMVIKAIQELSIHKSLKSRTPQKR